MMVEKDIITIITVSLKGRVVNLAIMYVEKENCIDY